MTSQAPTPACVHSGSPRAETTVGSHADTASSNTPTQWLRSGPLPKSLVEQGCNYVPRLHMVQWRKGTNVALDVQVARDLAAADDAPYDWCSQAEAATAPSTTKGPFYARARDTPFHVHVLELEQVAMLLYSALVCVHQDASSRASGRRSARRLWEEVFRLAVPALPTWPWDSAADELLDRVDAVARDLRNAQQGLVKAVGKANRAAARVEHQADEPNSQERASAWKERVLERQQRVQMVAAELDTVQRAMAALPPCVTRVVREAEVCAARAATAERGTYALLSGEPMAQGGTLPLMLSLEPTRLRGAHWEFELAAFDPAARVGVLVAGFAWD